jgi:predicted dehydrogenase
MTSRFRAAIIGDTGHGNYGHDLDTSFAAIPAVELVAVADPDAVGRQAAQGRTGAPRGYADYREMLEQERPNLALVCPRWCDQRQAMITACVQAGVQGIYCEKPLAPTLAAADAIEAACRAAGVRLVVAHRSRENPYMQWLRALLAEGTLGKVEAIRAHGKCDRRAGGLDLAVLAPHLFDQMRYLLGAPLWVSAYVTEAGRPIDRSDATRGAEGVGLIAGDRISATFAFADGVLGHYETYPGDRAGEHWYGFEVHCTHGIVAVRNLPRGEVYRYPYGLWMPPTDAGLWERVSLKQWDDDEGGRPRQGEDFMRESNGRHALALVRALEERREPEGTTTLGEAVAVQEMVNGIYASHLRGGRVPLPLADRGDPLDAVSAATVVLTATS